MTEITIQWRKSDMTDSSVPISLSSVRYTSGDVRLWDTLHWDSRASYLKPNGLTANTDPRPHVDHVQVNGTVAAAAYEDGMCRHVTVV